MPSGAPPNETRRAPAASLNSTKSTASTRWGLTPWWAWRCMPGKFGVEQSLSFSASHFLIHNFCLAFSDSQFLIHKGALANRRIQRASALRADWLQAVAALGTETEARLHVRPALRAGPETGFAQNEVQDDSQRVRNEDRYQRPQKPAHAPPAGVTVYISDEQNKHRQHAAGEKYEAFSGPEGRGLRIAGHHRGEKNLHSGKGQEGDEIGNRGNDADLVRESSTGFVSHLHRCVSFSQSDRKS